MSDAKSALSAREEQIDQILPREWAVPQSATRGDILALEKTIILAARQISETIYKARY